MDDALSGFLNWCQERGIKFTGLEIHGAERVYTIYYSLIIMIITETTTQSFTTPSYLGEVIDANDLPLSSRNFWVTQENDLKEIWNKVLLELMSFVIIELMALFYDKYSLCVLKQHYYIQDRDIPKQQ
uniref:Transmembrane protein 231 n=1 Tax=Heterorhabditis bacteriophora TaxID=37862 RepID=A0A1I7X1V4_HETBA